MRLREKVYVTSKSLYILINVDVICHLKTMTNVKFIHFLLLPQLLLHIVVHIRNWLCQQEKCIFRTSELRKKLDKFLKSTSKNFAKTTKWLTALCNAQFRFEFLRREFPYFYKLQLHTWSFIFCIFYIVKIVTFCLFIYSILN